MNISAMKNSKLRHFAPPSIIKFSERGTVALLGCLMLSATAQAASFDCAKAGTKVEHIICNNPEISRLDEELAMLYKAVIQSQASAKQIRLTQKQWMTDRDNCADDACVQEAYQVRIVQLNLADGAAMQAQSSVVPQKLTQTTGANTESTISVKKYPPYPDVWELVIPPSKNMQQQGVRGGRMENGDVMIGYVLPEKIESRTFQAIPNKDLGWRTFFSRQKAEIINEATGETRLDDGTIVRPVKRTGGVNYFPNIAELKDGSYVSTVSGSFDRGCYQGPAGNTLTRYKSKATWDQLLPSKVVFLLLDEPFTFPTGSVDGPNRSPKCDAAEQQVTTRVVSLAGEILPLEDGGFLLLNTSYGWVIRFDANLNTHTKQLNKKLFVLDSEILGATGFIEKITGKNYMDEHGWTKMQEVVDDLYAHLIKLSKGEK